MIKTMAIVGGTHGNELTGVYLIKKMQQEDCLAGLGKSIDVHYLLANPKAYAVNKRYINRDLNRSFSQKDLSNLELSADDACYEDTRAKEINDLLGPKGNSKTDFIIDLHTSTAPMGINLVITKADPFHLKLVDYVQQKIDGVTITWEEIPDHHFLMSIAEKNVLVEIGATPQGVLRQDVFDKTEATAKLIGDYIKHHNNGSLPASSDNVDVYKYFGVEYLPQNDKNEITGMVHQNIQDRDFQELKNGEPIFKLFDGPDVLYDGEDCTISFINEAAYYDEKKAFSKSRVVRLSIAGAKD